MSTLQALAEQIDQINQDKGWNETWKLSDALTNVHAEVSEAWEEVREGRLTTWYSIDKRGISKPEGVPPELADVLIRVLHICYRLGINPDEVVAEKLAYNRTRDYRHGNKTA